MTESIWLRDGFNVLVLAMRGLDPGVVALILATPVVTSLPRPRKVAEFAGPAGPETPGCPLNPASGSNAS